MPTSEAENIVKLLVMVPRQLCLTESRQNL